MQKGIQQIMLRNNVGSESKARQALHEIKQDGFDGIELNSYMTHPLPWTIRLFTAASGMAMGAGGSLDWHKLLKEAELPVLSYHTDLGTLLKRPEEVIKEAQSYDTHFVVLTGMYHFDCANADDVHKLIDDLNTAGKNMEQGGLEFLYHNHNCEFLNAEGSTKAYQMIIEGTDPDLVGFEFDSYWPTEAGVDALHVMKELGPRMRLWHINDRGSRPNGKTSSILKSDAVELGTGNINFIPMIEQAQQDHTEAVILEQHTNWINKDALTSISISSKYLNEHIH